MSTFNFTFELNNDPHYSSLYVKEGRSCTHPHASDLVAMITNECINYSLLSIEGDVELKIIRQSKCKLYLKCLITSSSAEGRLRGRVKRSSDLELGMSGI